MLLGKASVKVKADNPQDVIGKDLTFYYFNPETQKPEKIQGPLSVDNDGFVTVEIEHCSDYFLSESDNLADAPEPINLTVNKSEVNLVEGSSEKLIVNVTPEGTEVHYSSSNEGVAKVSSNGVIEAIAKGEANLPQTGGMVSMNNALIISITIIGLGVMLLKRKKVRN